jgi:hybrid cluster-associated redox disulfide protein
MLCMLMVCMGTIGDRPLTPNDTIAELLATYPAAARVLVGHRMHCVGCDIAPFETIANACVIYGVAVDDLFAEIHRAMGAQEDNR